MCSPTQEQFQFIFLGGEFPSWRIKSTTLAALRFLKNSDKFCRTVHSGQPEACVLPLRYVWCSKLAEWTFFVVKYRQLISSQVDALSKVLPWIFSLNTDTKYHTWYRTIKRPSVTAINSHFRSTNFVPSFVSSFLSVFLLLRHSVDLMIDWLYGYGCYVELNIIYHSWYTGQHNSHPVTRHTNNIVQHVLVGNLLFAIIIIR